MKKNILKITALAASLVMALSACQANTPPAATAAPAAPAPAVETPAAPAPETPAAPEAKAPVELVKVTIGATAVPHAELLNEIVEDLKAEGVDLVVQEFSEWTLLNPSTDSGDIDANFFQHLPYLENYCADSKQELVSVGNVHVEPMGVYSKKVKALSELPDKAKIGIPNDATNEARALILLEKNGLIKLKEGVGLSATPNDIAENPKNFAFSELAAELLPRLLEDTDISVINTNYALDGGLNPLTDALVMEDKDSPYANILVVKKGNENNEAILKVYKALTTDKMRKFIEDKYKGAIVPAF